MVLLVFGHRSVRGRARDGCATDLSGMVLRTRYAVSSTGVGRGAVLTPGAVLCQSWYCSWVWCYTKAGAKVGYIATRGLVLKGVMVVPGVAGQEAYESVFEETSVP
eukprot:377874-Rhodomonas_salina.3